MFILRLVYVHKSNDLTAIAHLIILAQSLYLFLSVEKDLLESLHAIVGYRIRSASRQGYRLRTLRRTTCDTSDLTSYTTLYPFYCPATSLLRARHFSIHTRSHASIPAASSGLAVLYGRPLWELTPNSEALVIECYLFMGQQARKRK